MSCQTVSLDLWLLSVGIDNNPWGQYHTTTDHKEGEQLEDRRSVGASSFNSGDGTDQRAQSLIFIMMMMMMMDLVCPQFPIQWVTVIFSGGKEAGAVKLITNFHLVGG